MKMTGHSLNGMRSILMVNKLGDDSPNVAIHSNWKAILAGVPNLNWTNFVCMVYTHCTEPLGNS